MLLFCMLWTKKELMALIRRYKILNEGEKCLLFIVLRMFLLYFILRQARFILPGTSGSPPKILTMDEVRYAIKNVEDMTLAHEIAINPEFRLEPYDPPENSLEKKIKTILHDVFWDILRDQLESDPPSYDQAIILLGDIREVKINWTDSIRMYNINLNLVSFRKIRISPKSFRRTIRRPWIAFARCWIHRWFVSRPNKVCSISSPIRDSSFKWWPNRVHQCATRRCRNWTTSMMLC